MGQKNFFHLRVGLYFNRDAGSGTVHNTDSGTCPHNTAASAHSSVFQSWLGSVNFCLRSILVCFLVADYLIFPLINLRTDIDDGQSPKTSCISRLWACNRLTPRSLWSTHLYWITFVTSLAHDILQTFATHGASAIFTGVPKGRVAPSGTPYHLGNTESVPIVAIVRLGKTTNLKRTVSFVHALSRISVSDSLKNLQPAFPKSERDSERRKICQIAIDDMRRY